MQSIVLKELRDKCSSIVEQLAPYNFLILKCYFLAHNSSNLGKICCEERVRSASAINGFQPRFFAISLPIPSRLECCWSYMLEMHTLQLKTSSLHFQEALNNLQDFIKFFS
jgi:hypothetical protein